MAMDPRAQRDDSSQTDLEHLSALIDGECSAAEATAFARRWSAESAVQRHWDTYHLIGDALRSDDLCRHPQGTDFMHRLRERLAAEPVVVAPAPLPRPAVRRLRWMRPVSAAAGVMAVAGSVWLLPVRQSGVQDAATLASAPSAAPAVVAPKPAAVATRPAAEWDRYLAAHQQFQSGAAVVPVSGYLRHADHDTGR